MLYMSHRVLYITDRTIVGTFLHMRKKRCEGESVLTVLFFNSISLITSSLSSLKIFS